MKSFIDLPLICGLSVQHGLDGSDEKNKISEKIYNLQTKKCYKDTEMKVLRYCI